MCSAYLESCVFWIVVEKSQNLSGIREFSYRSTPLLGLLQIEVFFPMSLSSRQLSSMSPKKQFIFKCNSKSHILQLPVN